MFPTRLLQLVLSKVDGGSRYLWFLTKQKLHLASIFLKFGCTLSSTLLIQPMTLSAMQLKQSQASSQQLLVKELTNLQFFWSILPVNFSPFDSSLRHNLTPVLKGRILPLRQLEEDRCTFSFWLLVADMLQAKTWCCCKVLLKRVLSQPHVKDITWLEIGVTGSWLFFFLKKM